MKNLFYEVVDMVSTFLVGTFVFFLLLMAVLIIVLSNIVIMETLTGIEILKDYIYPLFN